MLKPTSFILSAISIVLLCMLPVGCDKNSNPANDDQNEPDSMSVTDIDGNVYQTIKIGDQWWMAENLKVTHFRNGEPLPYVAAITEWIDLSTPAQCFYFNDSTYLARYGRLYNWYAVEDSRNLAPQGWHIPSLDEWQTLTDDLGGLEVAGGKLKTTGTTQWLPPNTGSTNESGFSAKPGGCRDWTGHWTNVRHYAYFWSLTEADTTNAWHLYLCYYYESAVIERYDQRTGFSIRCVRD
jgi:uncharacterized protein (TIGR02145 family)